MTLLHIVIKTEVLEYKVKFLIEDDLLSKDRRRSRTFWGFFFVRNADDYFLGMKIDYNDVILGYKS